MAKFKVVHSIPGRIRLRTKVPREMYKEVSLYDKYIEEALYMLDGIDKVEFNYAIGTILINYNPKKTYESKVVEWINEIIRVGIENSDLMEKYAEKNIDYVVDTVKQQLAESLKSV